MTWSSSTTSTSADTPRAYRPLASPRRCGRTARALRRSYGNRRRDHPGWQGSWEAHGRGGTAGPCAIMTRVASASGDFQLSADELRAVARFAAESAEEV